MRYFVIIVGIVSVLFSGTAAAKTPVKLFNGKDFSGWYAFEPGVGKQSNASKLFTVDQKMIRLYGEKAGYLMSKKSYRNFQLLVEYRWNMDTSFVRKSQTKNSGIMYLVPEKTPDMLWPRGIQFQIKEGSTGDFVLLQEVTMEVDGKVNTPGKSVVRERFEDAEKPAGEWNTILITSDHGRIRQELNGVPVNEGLNPSVTHGRILLQYEGFPIDFRRIEIVEF
jgi:hypothetical protein